MKIFNVLDKGLNFYLKISKYDFIELGCDPNKISKYSGHTIDTLYLVEEYDLYYFFDLMDAKGIEYKNKIKPAKNIITHNYNPDFFDWNYDKPVVLKNGIIANVEKDGKVLCENGKVYKIPKSKLDSPFEYFKAVHKSVIRPR